MKKLSVPEQHQLGIARQVLKESNVFTNIFGGMTKEEAEKIIKKYSKRKK